MSLEFQYKGVRIRVLKGDITKVKADAIVNPANSLMIMGGGVAGAIRRVEGEEIEKEAMKHAPVPVGDAVVTRAKRLKAKYVIHAPTMERPAMRTTKEKVEMATKAALKKAFKLRIKSIAFPGMGTGVGGLDYYEAALVMVDSIRDHIDHTHHLSEVFLVAYDDKLYKAFKKACERFFSNPQKQEASSHIREPSGHHL
ncbi:MAG: macro domain-containing protein [Thermoprotei archaeon]|nr:MAG: macro domain-containing protein [Thermoprotei archaeon]